MPTPHPTISSQTLTLTQRISVRRCGGRARVRTLALTATPASACSFRLGAAARGSSPPSPFDEAFPYVSVEWKTIAKGWACAAAAVYCLSRAVPTAGVLPRALADWGAGSGGAEVLKGGVQLAGLAAARSAAVYAQQALLWEAALRAAGRLRERTFEGVLARDLAFFEGRGLSADGIARRITDEADDVADAAYSVLNMIVPTCSQLIAMGHQMVTINPLLSIVAATVLPSMLTVKANNGEGKEILRFHKLVIGDLKNNLCKKNMKVLIPQVIRATYIGGLIVLCAGSVALSGACFDGEAFLSFLAALALAIEPIQDLGKAYNEYKQGEPALERIFDLTRFIPVVRDKATAVPLRSVKGDIKFHDVTFGYVDSMPPVVDGMNLHIRSGETIAFVGPSEYNPQSGCILVDNCDIQDIQLQCLRTHIAFVSQDAVIYCRGNLSELLHTKYWMKQLQLWIAGLRNYLKKH